MFCPSCGNENPDGASRCSSCNELLAPEQSIPSTTANAVQPPPPQTPQTPQTPQMSAGNFEVPDYFVKNIVMTIIFSLCCAFGVVFGVVGIIFSSRVRIANAVGNKFDAESAASTAKIMFFINIGLLALMFLLGIAYFVGIMFLGLSGEF